MRSPADCARKQRLESSSRWALRCASASSAASRRAATARELALDLLAMGARLGGGLLGGGELGLVPAQIVPAEFPSRLERLAFETGVELGGLGLALERSQARAGLALDV